MNDYLNDVEYAVSILIEAIWKEYKEAEAILTEVNILSTEISAEYQTVANLQESDDPEDTLLATGRYWDTYFGGDKQLYYKKEEMEEKNKTLEALKFSIESLSASLLQHAKQGLSITHGQASAWPNGRIISSQSMSNIIRAARNQAEHWEERKFNNATTSCFKALKSEVDVTFGEFTERNMAFDIVKLFGWDSLDKFKQDMEKMA